MLTPPKINVITKNLTDSEVLDQVRQIVSYTEESMEGIDSDISKVIAYNEIRDLLDIEYQTEEAEEEVQYDIYRVV